MLYAVDNLLSEVPEYSLENMSRKQFKELLTVLNECDSEKVTVNGEDFSIDAEKSELTDSLILDLINSEEKKLPCIVEMEEYLESLILDEKDIAHLEKQYKKAESYYYNNFSICTGMAFNSEYVHVSLKEISNKFLLAADAAGILNDPIKNFLTSIICAAEDAAEKLEKAKQSMRPLDLSKSAQRMLKEYRNRGRYATPIKTMRRTFVYNTPTEIREFADRYAEYK